MVTTAKKEATYDDLYHIPEHMTGEIIDGELIVSPRPARRHVEVASSLGGELVPPYRFGRGGPGGWLVYFEPEVHLGTHVIVPDFGAWKRERLSIPPEEHRFTVPPDWVCEILSPGTARTVRVRKMRIFAEYEIPYAWIIDPVLMTVEVYALQSGKWVVSGLYEGDEKMRAEPFTEVEIDLANLWMEDAPAEPHER